MITAKQAQNIVAENLTETPLYREILDKLNKKVENHAEQCFTNLSYVVADYIATKDLPDYKRTMKRIKKDFHRRGFTFNYKYGFIDMCTVEISW